MPTDESVAAESEELVRSREPRQVREARGRAGNEADKQATAKAPPPSRAPGQEISRLNALVSEHEIHARKTKTQLTTLQKKCEQVEADNARIRGELRGLREELATSQKELNVEMGLARQRETELQEDLSDARGEITLSHVSAAHTRKVWISVSVSIAFAAASGLIVLYLQMRKAPDVSPAAATAASVSAAVTTPPAEEPPPAPKPPDFATALARLEETLKRFKGDDPEDVLRQVHALNAARGVSVCSFEWNNGQPSLLFGSKSGSNLANAIGGGDTNLALEPALSLCADALNAAAAEAHGGTAAPPVGK